LFQSIIKSNSITLSDTYQKSVEVKSYSQNKEENRTDLYALYSLSFSLINILITKAVYEILCYNYFFFISVHPKVMLLEPHEAKYEVLFIQLKYCKQNLLRMYFIIKYSSYLRAKVCKFVWCCTKYKNLYKEWEVTDFANDISFYLYTVLSIESQPSKDETKIKSYVISQSGHIYSNLWIIPLSYPHFLISSSIDHLSLFYLGYSH